MLTATDLQRQTLRLYGELVSRRESWGGQLVFTSGGGSSASGLPTAVSISGGTTLALDPDGLTVKAVFRQGGVDFVVNTLDEALRVLKNEIRQHRPLGVGLIAEIEPVLAEMAERGVLPDLQIGITGSGVAAEPSQQQALESLRQNGMKSLQLQTNSLGAVVPSAEAAAWRSRLGWHEALLVLDSSVTARATDAPLIEMLPSSDHIRRNWTERIPKYQRDARATRLVWMTEKEQRDLALYKGSQPWKFE
jgi:hypothetical protein